MPESGPRRDREPSDRVHRAAPLALLIVALVVLLAVVWADRQGPAKGAPPGAVDIVYVSVTGEGSTAKAWYDGAPSPGVPVQDALDKFAKEGYHVVETREVTRSGVDTSADPTALVILLERAR